MRPDRESGHAEASMHPLAELLACPQPISNLLSAAAECIEFESGQTIFQQESSCRGLYVVISGELLRKAERIESRIVLGSVSPGQLVELAAALGNESHTYTLMGQTSGLLMLLPIGVLQQSFQSYPPLKMQLLTELAREVSRAYTACRSARLMTTRRGGRESPTPS